MAATDAATPSRWRRLQHRASAWAERKLPALTRHRRAEALPVVLDRRRIYTVPTRFGFSFALLLLVMLLGALNYGNNAAILLTCLLAATAGASLFFGFRNLSGLRLTGLRAGEAHAGETIAVELQFAPGLRNRASLRCEHAEQAIHFALPMGEDGRVVLNLLADRRGWWRPGRIGIATDYPLGLFVAWSWMHPDRSVLVFPRIESDPPPLPFDASAAGEQPANAGDDDYSGLREYRPSDPPRRIAWKASAHRDDLLVRESERQTGRSLVLDYVQLRGLDHEARIARLTAWVLIAEAQQAAYALLLPDNRIDAAVGPAQRANCLRALALLPP